MGKKQRNTHRGLTGSANAAIPVIQTVLRNVSPAAYQGGASKNYFEMRRKQEEKEKRDRQQAANADAVRRFIKEEQEREEKADKTAILRRCMTGIGICFAMIAFVLLMVIAWSVYMMQ